jgi:hypothetical protein
MDWSLVRAGRNTRIKIVAVALAAVIVLVAAGPRQIERDDLPAARRLSELAPQRPTRAKTGPAFARAEQPRKSAYKRISRLS